jgi:hypothetical protein
MHTVHMEVHILQDRTSLPTNSIGKEVDDGIELSRGG